MHMHMHTLVKSFQMQLAHGLNSHSMVADEGTANLVDGLQGGPPLLNHRDGEHRTRHCVAGKGLKRLWVHLQQDRNPGSRVSGYDGCITTAGMAVLSSRTCTSSVMRSWTRAAKADSSAGVNPWLLFRPKRRDPSNRVTLVRPTDAQMDAALAAHAVAKFVRGPTCRHNLDHIHHYSAEDPVYRMINVFANNDGTTHAYAPQQP